jgi:hypothetical protein
MPNVVLKTQISPVFGARHFFFSCYIRGSGIRLKADLRKRQRTNKESNHQHRREERWNYQEEIYSRWVVPLVW